MTKRQHPAAEAKPPAEPVATEPVNPDQLASDGDQVRPGLSEESDGSK